MNIISWILRCSSLLYCITTAAQQQEVTHLIFTSDLHFGLTKEKFRGRTNVSAVEVNREMVHAMESIVNQNLPADGFAGSRQKIETISGLIIAGDIVNRQEVGIQSAKVSGRNFKMYY